MEIENKLNNERINKIFVRIKYRGKNIRIVYFLCRIYKESETTYI